MKFKEIGWNGFLLTVPEEMHLTRQGGDANRGTFLLESEGSLIEFSWQPIPKKPKPLASVVEGIVEQTRKKVEKEKQKFSIYEKKNVSVNNHNAVYLRLKSVIEERYYIWYCQESNRIVVSRFVFETFNEKSRNFIKQFINTLKCHMKEKNVWSLMKVRFNSPQSFLLKEAKIEVGRTHLTLAENKLSMFTEKVRTINIDYFTMANLTFKDTYEDPEKWFEKNYLKDLKKILKKRWIKFETIDKKEIENHKIVIKQAKATSGLYIRSTEFYSNASWYCPEINRMYSVTFSSKISRPFFFKRELKKEEHDELFNEILESFQCH